MSEYKTELAKFEDVDLSEVGIGDTFAIEACGIMSGTTRLLLTKTADNKLSIAREYWFRGN